MGTADPAGGPVDPPAPVTTPSWRYVVGTFAVQIPVSTARVMLPAEENTLAILSWRLAQMDPSNRWVPVLQRYIGYIKNRVDGLGGNSSTVIPSPYGAIPQPRHRRCEHTGKIEALIYDRLGDFEGFRLLTEHGDGTITSATKPRSKLSSTAPGRTEASSPSPAKTPNPTTHRDHPATTPLSTASHSAAFFNRFPNFRRNHGLESQRPDDHHRRAQRRRPANSGWHHHALTAATGAPPAGASPTGYVFDAQGTQHVNYVGMDSHVYELWWNAAGWHYNDLTTAAGAPPAQINRDAVGYVFPSQGTQHVNYVGTDNHIHELWWNPASWHHNDLTTAAGARDANSEPYGFMFAGTQQVLFLGTDNHIHELSWDSAGWHDTDLTAATAALPTQSAEPAGYSFEAYGSQHVIYAADNGHVTELFWTP